MKRQTLEAHIRALLSDSPQDATFNIAAHELWRDHEGGWSSNDRWLIIRDATLPDALAAIRGRWEIFKVNYSPRARVADITDNGEGNHYSLECDHIPFVDITVNEPDSGRGERHARLAKEAIGF
jgi:hypothetical protein